MKHSTERILTTHSGSLPRADDLLEKIVVNATGSAIAEGEHAARVERAVGAVVRQQIDVGIELWGHG